MGTLQSFGSQSNKLQQTPDQLATEIMAAIARRVNVTTTQRADFEKFIANKVRPFVEQPSLFSPTLNDEHAFKAQCYEIVKLLKERRSYGAFNHELAKISIKYTSRISDLRKQGYRITCKRDGESRTFLYTLGAESW